MGLIRKNKTKNFQAVTDKFVDCPDSPGIYAEEKKFFMRKPSRWVMKLPYIASSTTSTLT